MTLEQVFANVLQEPVEIFTDASSPQTLEKWNSLKHIELIMQIEIAYGVKFSAPEIASLRSLGDIRAILTRRGIHSA